MHDANRQQPVAQKKHQMYGKRFAHESVVLPPPIVNHPHASNGTATADPIPNIPIKYEPYDPYSGAGHSSASSSTSSAPSSAVAKPPTSLMDPELKYSYALDFPHQRHKNGNSMSSHEMINHNHTYTMPPHPHPNTTQLLNNNGANPKPQMRDKKSKKMIEDEHYTRDEKRARAMQIPIAVMGNVTHS